MFVKLKYKTIEGKIFSINKKGNWKGMTKKQAKELFNERKMAEDKNIVQVGLFKFDGWHWFLIETLKGV